jgi:TPP-dependent pyruvate/acetoin dehydrogenase alpha subunit
VREEIVDAIAFAESSPYPDPDDILRDVYTV